MAKTLREIYQSPQTVLSFELFPPKTEAGEKALYRHVQQLMAFQPPAGYRQRDGH